MNIYIIYTLHTHIYTHIYIHTFGLHWRIYMKQTALATGMKRFLNMNNLHKINIKCINTYLK